VNESIAKHAERVMKKLAASGATIATVESCTAGALVHLLSRAEGASDTLHGGFVVYTKDNKTAAVGVSEELLKERGAVSAEVAEAMAAGGLARCPAAIVTASTGVAGPQPDEDGNPVGLVFVAAALRDGRRKVARRELGKRGKDAICHAAMQEALALVEELLPGRA
jgi:nicotinamide-nucleotide amidase